jgi:hypothetical protein
MVSIINHTDDPKKTPIEINSIYLIVNMDDKIFTITIAV